MEKNIINEIDQMKYLFGYKPGKVISEQVTPVTPQKNQKTNTPNNQKLKREDLILKEMLENLSKGTYAYASKIEPTKIYVITAPGVKEYGGIASNTEIGSSIDFGTYTISDNTRQAGMRQGRMGLSTRTMEEALTALNNNTSVVAFANIYNPVVGVEELADVYMYLTTGGTKDIEETINILKTAQPNILPKLIQSIQNKIKMESDANQKRALSSALQKITQVTGQ